MKKILGVIPARGGSKRLPGKNIKLLGDHPLIAWTIRAAYESNVLCDLVVSTDDPAIKAVAETYGVNVPWLRPERLATDTASSMDVLFHALEEYEISNGQVDGVMLLQPTSPFRTAATIVRAANLFAEHASSSIVGLAPAPVPPEWCFRVHGEKMQPVIEKDGTLVRSQDLEPAYVISGAMYIAAREFLYENKTYFTKDTLPLIVDNIIENLDIDTPHDWNFAQFLLTNMTP